MLPRRFSTLLVLAASATALTCVDDPDWYHKRRGEDYDCEWVANKVPTRCDVKGVMKGDDQGLTVLASVACQAACGCDYTDLDPGVENVVFFQDGPIDDYLGEVMLMEAHDAGEINFLGSAVLNADSMTPTNVELVYKFREMYGNTEPYVGLSPSKLFNQFPWGYRVDSARIAAFDIVEAVDTKIPDFFPDANAWLTTVLEDAPEGSITLMYVVSATPLYDIFNKKPELMSKVKKMIWMGGAIDSSFGNLEFSGDNGNPYWPKCLESYGWCGSQVNFSTAEWNIFADAYAAAWIMAEATFPITIYPLDASDFLPIPGTFMDTLEAYGDDHDCNPEVYGTLLEAYEKFAAPNLFYRLWDTGAIMYFLAPELYGEPEMAELCIGDSWQFYGFTRRKSEIDAGKPAAELMTRDGSDPACREVALVLNIADDDDPQPLFDYASKAACAEGTG